MSAHPITGHMCCFSSRWRRHSIGLLAVLVLSFAGGVWIGALRRCRPGLEVSRPSRVLLQILAERGVDRLEPKSRALLQILAERGGDRLEPKSLALRRITGH